MKFKYVLWTVTALILLIIFGFLSLTFGMKNSLVFFLEVIVNYDKTNPEHIIFISHLARVLVAVSVGASLALAGFIMQLQYKNDLADPTLMGVSDGSALAIVIGMIFMPNLTMLGRIIFSVIGSFLAYIIISYIYKIVFLGQSRLTFPLIGIVISMLLSSMTTFLVSYYNIAQSVNSWYNSRLYRVSFSDVVYFWPILLLLIFLIVLLRKQMDIYSYGHSITTSIGMERIHWENFYSVCVVILTGVSVAIVGRIAFVGLVIPHIVKLSIGKKYAASVFFVPLTGGIFVLMSDYLSRYINYPFETPIGVVIALVGVPIFLYLIRRGATVH